MDRGELVATIADDGDPGPVPWVSGVGLASMRERAGELGGRLAVDRGADGTRVRAELPIGPNGAGRP